MFAFIYGLIYTFLVAVAVFFAYRLSVAYRLFSIKTDDSVDETELPSVSVCIPARNETHAMTQCLESVLRSKYPKIETIVLDDSSNDNTSFLVKSFAHTGVRFVEGAPLPDDWLGKNFALENLMHEASGSYILYLDVDTQVESDTIGRLIDYTRKNKAMMVSVLPRRNDGWRASVVMASLRYFWGLIFHSRSNPATASNAWLIHRHTLRDEIGGFAKFRLDVQPEVRLAAYLSRSNRYRFLIGDRQLGVSYEKKWRSQVETSVRLLLPMVGGKTVSGAFALLFLLMLSTPLLTLLASLFVGWTIYQSTALWLTLVYCAIYATYSAHTWRKAWWMGGLLWPVLIAQEAFLMFLSIYKYTNNQVTWKGRPILAPKAAHKLFTER